MDDGKLKAAVLYSVRNEARKILTSEDIARLDQIKDKYNRRKEYQDQINHIENEIRRMESYKKKTYQNFMENILSKEDYLFYTQEYTSDIFTLKEQKNTLNKQIENEGKHDREYDEWVEQFKDYINIDELTREVVLELIEKIEVNEDGSVSIFYQFSNVSL